MNSADLQTRDRTALIAKIALLMVFALGLSIIYMGVSGLRSYEESGFSSETAFQAVYSLSELIHRR